MGIFKILKNDSHTKARAGTINFRDVRIETPVLWLGYNIGSNPKPWKFFAAKTIAVNSYEVMRWQERRNLIQADGIHNYLGFKGGVMLDSGGFQILNGKKFSISDLELLRIYEEVNPTIGVVLDHPLNPLVSEKENKKRWNHTLENTQRMIENNGHINLMPVVHGLSLDGIENACKDIKDIMKPKLIGIGSLVPLAKGIRGQTKFSRVGENEPNSRYTGKRFLVDAICIVRREFPSAFFHVFGVGGMSTMHLLFALGVDSLDSIGWRLKAGYGAIQLPGTGDRVLSTRQPTKNHSSRRVVSQEELEILANCRCPVCRPLTIEQRVKTLDSVFQLRALHNAWVYSQEASAFRRRIKTGTVKQFALKRLESSSFFSEFAHLLNGEV